MPREVLFIIFVVAFFGIFWRYSADRKHVRKLQQDATQGFENLAVRSQDKRYQLNGSSAVVERREEIGGLRGMFTKVADLTVAIYARNEYGERCLFIWQSNSTRAPLVKHLPREVAYQ